MKTHNILIEPWRDPPRLGHQKSVSGYRWTVSYDLDGLFFAQGFANSHAEARAAAQAFLIEKGVNLDWYPRPGADEKPDTRDQRRHG